MEVRSRYVMRAITVQEDQYIKSFAPGDHTTLIKVKRNAERALKDFNVKILG
jgi:hypothetical protein